MLGKLRAPIELGSCSLEARPGQRKEVLLNPTGVVNGIDYEEWHPAGDTFLRRDGYCNYDAGSLDGKARCKAALQRVGVQGGGG